MRTGHRLVTLALALALSACGSTPSTPSAPALGQRAAALSAPPATFHRFYHQIRPRRGAGRDDTLCQLDLPPPLAPHIDSTLLFDSDLTAPAPDGEEIEAVFCTHTARLTPTQLAALEDHVGPDVELYPPRLSALGAADVKATAHARLVGAAGMLDLDLDRGRARVAVLDSAGPGHAGLPGTGAASPHGEDMALLIREALCPSNTPVGRGCAIEIETAAALDLDATADGLVHAPHGGRFGDPGALAREIHRAVARAARDDVPLVINLSVGWIDDGRDAASSNAVYAALRQARDRGVLVVAAAGNQQDGPLDPGSDLMTPARWSQTQHRGDSRPLVVSAAAIGIDGALVPNARDYGAAPPTLTAYGAHAVADARYLTPGATRSILDGAAWTGSSVSAALVSAAAAAQLARGLDAPAIIDQLVAQGQLGRPLRICAALGQTCRTAHHDPRPLPAPTASLVPSSSATVAACGGDVIATEGPFARFIDHDAGLPTPRPTSTLPQPLTPAAQPAPTPDPAEVCPSAAEVNPLGLDRVDPQPDFPGCDVCALDATAHKLLVKLSADALDLTLKVVDRQGHTRWVKLAPQLSAGDEQTFALDPALIDDFKTLEVSGMASADGKSSSFEDTVMLF